MHNDEREGFPTLWSSVPWRGPGMRYKLARGGNFAALRALKDSNEYTKCLGPRQSSRDHLLESLNNIMKIIISSWPHSRSMHRRRSG